jgi:hypothetical protein
LAQFAEEDYDTLEHIVSKFSVVATTPNVLTEVSNLCDNLSGDDKNNYLTCIVTHINLIAEEYVPARIVAAATAFSQFGLSDAVLAEIAGRQFLVLTVDGTLYHFLTTLSLPAINFNHIRTAYWANS